MNVGDINPLIRFAKIAAFPPVPQFVYSYDSRLFYVIDGTGMLIIEGKSYKLSPNDLIIWKGGKKYCFKDYNNLNMIDINFDFTQRSNFHTKSIHPAPANDFDPSLLTEPDNFSDYQIFNSHLYMNDMSNYRAPLMDILDLLSSNKLLKRELASAKLKSVLTKIAANSIEQKTSTVGIVYDVLEYLKANFNKNVTNSEVGKIFGYHPNYINRLMLRHTGVTIRQYILQLRIEKAIELLGNRDLSLIQISQECGFGNVYYFSNCFKEKMKMSPSAYRENIDFI